MLKKKLKKKKKSKYKERIFRYVKCHWEEMTHI